VADRTVGLRLTTPGERCPTLGETAVQSAGRLSVRADAGGRLTIFAHRAPYADRYPGASTRVDARRAGLGAAQDLAAAPRGGSGRSEAGRCFVHAPDAAVADGPVGRPHGAADARPSLPPA